MRASLLLLALAAGCRLTGLGDGEDDYPEDTYPPNISGTGIAFGMFDLPAHRVGLPYTGAVIALPPSDARRTLRLYGAEGVQVVLNLAGAGRHYVRSDGTFDLELWKRRVDRFRGIDFEPYVANGTVLGH